MTKSELVDRGAAIRDTLTARAADIICLTEGHPGNLPLDGHVVCSGAIHGYGRTEGRKLLFGVGSGGPM